MVKHMVMWSFKEEIPEEKKPELKAQIKEHLEGLVGVVPGLIKAEVVTDLLPSESCSCCGHLRKTKCMRSCSNGL